jgi:hypothetical protein
VKNFTAYFDDYDNGGQKSEHYSSADIAFSPGVVGGASLNFKPFRNAEISFISKYVGRQYFDNSSSKDRSLDAFYVQDARLSYSLMNKLFKATHFILQVNNVFDKKYVANGYTFSYQSGGSFVTENYYFPMAEINFMFGVNIELLDTPAAGVALRAFYEKEKKNSPPCGRGQGWVRKFAIAENQFEVLFHSTTPPARFLQFEKPVISRNKHACVLLLPVRQ